VVRFPLAHDGLVQLLQDVARGGDAPGCRGVQLQVSTINVAEDQTVVGGHRRLGLRDGIAGQRGQVLDGLVEQRHRTRAGRPDGNIPPVCERLAHLGSSCR
jgi:hypothetical protein